MNQNEREAAAAWSAAFADTATTAAPQFAGPLTAAIDAATAQAQASASQVDQAGKGAAAEIASAAEAAAQPQALKGVDSRSGEGIAEMFRLMRGEGGDVQEQQLGVLEEIRDALSDQESDYPFAIEGG
jgi:hypothetical protein